MVGFLWYLAGKHLLLECWSSTLRLLLMAERKKGWQAAEGVKAECLMCLSL